MEGRERELTRLAPLTLILSHKIPHGVLVMTLEHLHYLLLCLQTSWEVSKAGPHQLPRESGNWGKWRASGSPEVITGGWGQSLNRTQATCPLYPFQRGPWADPLEKGAEGSSSCSQEPSLSQCATSLCSHLTTPVCETQSLSLSSPPWTSQMYGKSRYLQSGVITRELLTGITFPLTRTHREPEPYFISAKNPTRGQLVQSPGLSSRNRILSAALRSSAFCRTLEVSRHPAPRDWVSRTLSPREEENPIPTAVPWSTGLSDLTRASTRTAPSQASPMSPLWPGRASF